MPFNTISVGFKKLVIDIGAKKKQRVSLVTDKKSGKEFLVTNMWKKGGFGKFRYAMPLKGTEELLGVKEFRMTAKTNSKTRVTAESMFDKEEKIMNDSGAKCKFQHLVTIEKGTTKKVYGFMPLLDCEMARIRGLDGLNDTEKKQAGAYLLSELMSDLTRLHKSRWVHHDLKCTNVMVGQDKIAVIDYGLSISMNEIDDHGPYFQGTPEFWPTFYFYKVDPLFEGKDRITAFDIFGMAFLWAELVLEKSGNHFNNSTFWLERKTIENFKGRPKVDHWLRSGGADMSSGSRMDKSAISSFLLGEFVTRLWHPWVNIRQHLRKHNRDAKKYKNLDLELTVPKHLSGSALDDLKEEWKEKNIELEKKFNKRIDQLTKNIKKSENSDWCKHYIKVFERLEEIDKNVVAVFFTAIFHKKLWYKTKFSHVKKLLKQPDIDEGRKLCNKLAKEVSRDEHEKALELLKKAKEYYNNPPPRTQVSLVSRDNTKLSKSVYRSGMFKFKSYRLKRLLSRLKTYQKSPDDKSLIALHKSLWNWRCKCPKEFADRGTFGAMLYNEIMVAAELGSVNDILGFIIPDRSQFKPRYKLGEKFEDIFQPERGDVVYGLATPRTWYAMKIGDSRFTNRYWTMDQYNNIAFVTNWVDPWKDGNQDIYKPGLIALKRGGSQDDLKKALAYKSAMLTSRYDPSRVAHIAKDKLSNMEGFIQDATHTEEWCGNQNSCYKAIRRGCKFGLGLVATHPAFIGGGAKVHFILDNLEMKKVVDKAKHKGYGGRVSVSITTSEVRYAYRFWPWLTKAITFYLDGKSTEPPWREDYDLTLKKLVRKKTTGGDSYEEGAPYNFVSKKQWWADYGKKLAEKKSKGDKKEKPLV